MSHTQIAIPSTLEDSEENGVVERFMQASRDIVPSVQITLAKRIIRPGSNRVVYLAARTSIPLNDDEVASVSDLALRLSDGTNVALSLSFFNDALGSDYVQDRTAASDSEYRPLNRYVYDPSHYVKKNGSKLGFVLVGMAVVFAAGVFTMTHARENPLSPFTAGMKQSVAPAQVAAGKTLKPLTAYAGGQAIKFGPPGTAANSGTVKTVTTKSAAAKANLKNSVARTRSTSVHPKTATSVAHESMLVPPPPPTPYVFPYGNGMQLFDPRQALNAPAAKATNQDLKKEKTAANSESPKPSKVPNGIWSSETQSIPKSIPKSIPETDITTEQAGTEATDVSSIEPKVYRARQAQFWPSADKADADKLKMDKFKTEKATIDDHTAPAPGNETTMPIQLERIVPPVPTVHDNF